MVFNAKVDVFFRSFILIVIVIFGTVIFGPLLFEKEISLPLILILTLIFLLLIGFILWTTFSVNYTFRENVLLLKGGPFRSRIPYENITKVSSTTTVFTGHRILSSKDALEIFNTTTMLGSIKISPRNKDAFIAELKSRCPNIDIQV